MTARELARISARRFQDVGVPDAALDAQLLICHVLKLSRAQLVLDGDRELTADEQAACEALLARRESVNRFNTFWASNGSSAGVFSSEAAC